MELRSSGVRGAGYPLVADAVAHRSPVGVECDRRVQARVPRGERDSHSLVGRPHMPPDAGAPLRRSVKVQSRRRGVADMSNLERDAPTFTP